MTQARSFREYISHRFYNELFAATAVFLADCIASLDISSRKVSSIDTVDLSDIDVKQVYVDNRLDMRIAFDVLLEAQFEISELDRHNDRVEEKTTWFKVSCTGDLAQELNDFTIVGICEYNTKSKRTNPMDDALVPIIGKDRLEKEATDFLVRYYPEALKEPLHVEPETLAKRMKLKVTPLQITDDYSVFGQIRFVAGESNYYDSGLKKYVLAPVECGEIFVEPEAFFLRGLGSMNNTIIHECVHWDKHRKAFELERLYNSEAKQIKCKVVGGTKDATRWSATEIMEWQANALTPRIQMPYTQTKVKAVELIQQYKHMMQTGDTINVIEAVIDEVAAFFVVSRAAAKIRLIDLGFEEAVGTFTYIDGRYVKPHSFKKGTLQRNQTFSISSSDAAIQSIVNPELSEEIPNGKFLFVDSHFCINHPKYIAVDENGIPSMTDYARLHADECCLIFNLVISSSSLGVGKDYYTECVLYRDMSSSITFEAHYSGDEKNKETLTLADIVKAHNKDLSSLIQNLPNNFIGTLKGLMTWSDVTVEKLAEQSGISPRTIQRMRNETDYITTFETVMALCIGMKLPPEASSFLIDTSGFKLTYSEKHIAYRFILQGYYSHSIYECNDLLAGLGVEPLGTGDA